MASNQSIQFPQWVQVGVLLFALLLAAVLIVLPVAGMAVLRDHYGVQPTGESVSAAHRNQL